MNYKVNRSHSYEINIGVKKYYVFKVVKNNNTILEFLHNSKLTPSVKYIIKHQNLLSKPFNNLQIK